MAPYRLSLRFLAGILLACGDISTNPGPSSRFNCGLCDHRVTWRDQGVCCDECGIWYHVACQSIGRSTLGALNSSGVSWVCCSCNCPNYSAVYSYRSTDLSNAFEALSTSGSTSEQRSIASPIPLATSSPNYKCTSQMSNKSSCRPIRLLNLNARSLNKKKVDFCNLVESTQPDVIVCTESWLTSDITTGEIFSQDLAKQYSVFRRDREHSVGGEVLIAVSDEFVCSREHELETDCEILWVKICLVGCKSLYVCAYYKPHEGDERSLACFEQSFMKMNN